MDRRSFYLVSAVSIVNCIILLITGTVRLGTLSFIMFIGGLVLGFIIVVLTGAGSALADKLSCPEAAEDPKLAQLISQLSTFEAILFGGFIAPLTEEIVYRGAAWQLLAFWLPNDILVWLCTSLTFGLIHTGGPIRKLGTIASGCLLGLPILLGWPLWVPIIAHVTYNCLPMVAHLLIRRKQRNEGTLP